MFTLLWGGGLWGGVCVHLRLVTHSFDANCRPTVRPESFYASLTDPERPQVNIPFPPDLLRTAHIAHRPPPAPICHTQIVTPHLSHPICHTHVSHVFVTPHLSHLICHTPFVTLICHTPFVTLICHTPFVTPHLSHPTCHTPLVTRHFFRPFLL